MNLLAFACHTVRDCLEGLWTKAREVKRVRKRLFEHLRTITACYCAANMRQGHAGPYRLQAASRN